MRQLLYFSRQPTSEALAPCALYTLSCSARACLTLCKWSSSPSFHSTHLYHQMTLLLRELPISIAIALMTLFHIAPPLLANLLNNFPYNDLFKVSCFRSSKPPLSMGFIVLSLPFTPSHRKFLINFSNLLLTEIELLRTWSRLVFDNVTFINMILPPLTRKNLEIYAELNIPSSRILEEGSFNSA